MALAIALAVAAMLQPRAGHAHATGLSYVSLTVEGATVKASLDLPARDLAIPLGLDTDSNDDVSLAEVEAHDADLQAWLGANLAVRVDHRECTPSRGSTELHKAGLLTIRKEYDCADTFSQLALRSSMGQSIGEGYSTFVEVRGAGTTPLRTLLTGTDASYTFTFAGGEPWWRTALEFVWLGMGHIFLGYDHVLFLLALLMMCETLRGIVGLATAFTLAHTITLSLAATHTVVLPGRFIESAIAASIAWVAVENWVYAPRPVPGTRPPLGIRLRWLLTFTFGLIHGFGFASALAERGLPSQSVPLALGSFNVGVELGQVAIITLTYPLLRWLRARPQFRPQGVRFASVGIFGVAIYWFVQRAFFE